MYHRNSDYKLTQETQEKSVEKIFGFGNWSSKGHSHEENYMAATLCPLESALPGCCCLSARSFFYNSSVFPHSLPLFIQVHYFSFMAIMTIAIDATFPVIRGHFS